MRLKQENFPEKSIRISKNFEDAVIPLSRGEIVVSPTDTIIGILGDALNKKTVEYIYKVKKRNPEKPYIILIPDISYLTLFGIHPSVKEKILLESKGITVVLNLPEHKREELEYLHRGKGSLAFRIPDEKKLIEILKKIRKPVVAPSANPEGKTPAKSIKEAVNYFGNKVSLYFDIELNGKTEPSTIVKVEDGYIKILREGEKSIEEIERLLNKK